MDRNPTLLEALESYSRSRGLVEKTKRKDRFLLRRWYGDQWRDVDVLNISDEDIEKRYKELEPTGKETAVHAKRMVKRFITYTKDVLLQPQPLNQSAPTLYQAFNDYKRIRKLKSSTVRTYEQVLKNCCEDWLDKKLTDIGKKEILERYASVSERAPYLASSAMRSLRAIYNFSKHYYEDENEQPLIKTNPVEYLSNIRAWNKVDRARSIVYRHQLPDWLRGVLSLRHDTSRDYILFLWLTGCRPIEAAALRWTDVDLHGGMVTLRDTKNGKDHTIPVCSFIWELLRSRKMRASDPKGFVFPGKIDGKGICNNRKGYRMMCERLGTAWKHYDLRRGYATMASSLDIGFSVITRLLNHSDRNNVTMGYIVHDPETLRAAVEKIANQFLKLAHYDHKIRCVSSQPVSLDAPVPSATPLVSVGSVSIAIGGNSHE